MVFTITEKRATYTAFIGPWQKTGMVSFPEMPREAANGIRPITFGWTRFRRSASSPDGNGWRPTKANYRRRSDFGLRRRKTIRPPRRERPFLAESLGNERRLTDGPSPANFPPHGLPENYFSAVSARSRCGFRRTPTPWIGSEGPEGKSASIQQMGKANWPERRTRSGQFASGGRNVRGARGRGNAANRVVRANANGGGPVWHGPGRGYLTVTAFSYSHRP